MLENQEFLKEKNMMRWDRVRKDNVGLEKLKNFIWKSDKTYSVYGSKKAKVPEESYYRTEFTQGRTSER